MYSPGQAALERHASYLQPDVARGHIEGAGSPYDPVVINPPGEVVNRAVMVTIERYIVEEEDIALGEGNCIHYVNSYF